MVLFGSIFLFQNVLTAELININTATAEKLDTLPGIGASKAQAIVDYRGLNGAFITIEDIMNVSGIGQATYDGIKDLITVSADLEDEGGEVEENPVVNIDDLININTATAEELDTLPDIGATKAQAIVDYREANGLFAQKEDIINVSGIGQATYDNIKDLITVGDGQIIENNEQNNPETNTESNGNNTTITQSEPEVLGYETGSVVINEFVSDPSDGEVEFVELYNKYEFSIDLTGWWLEEGSGRKSILGGAIIPNGFFVLERPKGNLNNSGDIIKLFDATGGLIDKVSYGTWGDGNENDNAQKADDPLSVARIYDGADTDSDKIDFVLTKAVTKGSANIIYTDSVADDITTSTDKKTFNFTTTTIVTSTLQKTETKNSQTNIEDVKIIITEILPNPNGSDSTEMIELYNPTDIDFDLVGLKLDDEEGGSRPYVFKAGTIIKAGEYKVFGKWDTKIALNNTIDSARLLWTDSTIIDEIDYPSVIEGASFARNEEDEWQWTTNITPGAKNIFGKPVVKITGSNINYKPMFEVSLLEIKNQEVGSRVKVRGIVNVLPNIFGTQYFYITDNIAGAQVYMYSKDFPEFKVGDEVVVTGEISLAYGEKRIKIKEKKDIVVEGERELIAQSIDIGDISENFVGSFLQISGEVTEKKSTYIYVDDGTEEVKVYFKQNAQIDKQSFAVGDKLIVKGVLSGTASGYQLLPRSNMDIEISTMTSTTDQIVLGAEEKNEMTEKYLTATAGGLTSILIGFFIRARGFFVARLFRRMGLTIISLVKK